jgi:hypothetical protein
MAREEVHCKGSHWHIREGQVLGFMVVSLPCSFLVAPEGNVEMSIISVRFGVKRP